MSSSRPSELRWGVRASLLRYVSTSGGMVSVGEPASWDAEEFVFPRRDVGDDGPAHEIAFAGEFRIWAHQGLLDIQFADPVVQLSDGAGLLIASDLARTRRIAFADLIMTAPGVFGATLHADAVALFGGMYERGLALDDVRFGDQADAGE